MSKYKQVYRDLKEKIDTRVYKRNTELPSEFLGMVGLKITI